MENMLQLERPNPSDAPGKSSIRRFMLKIGYNLERLPKKIFISITNQEKRLIFAKKFIEKPSDFWDNIIWSDKQWSDQIFNTRIYLSRSEKGISSEKILLTRNLKMRGCRSCDLGPLVPIEGKLNALEYKTK
jgi:hypothetical protein